MKVFLDAWLPCLFPGWVEGQHFRCIPHEGKSDLEKSIPRKLKAWRSPGDCFVIVRDSDSADCRQVKKRLQELCIGAGRPETLVRLVCQELESWYLGDLGALATAFGCPHLNTPKLRKKFADPDMLNKPSAEVKRLVPAFQKTSGARAMAMYLSIDGNRSRSFQVFVDGIRRVMEGDGPKRS